MKTLSNELTRRLLNTSELLGDVERVVILDNYSQKLRNSGYGLDQIRKIILNGIKCYEKKLWESRTILGRKLHRTSAQSHGLRQRKKILGKTEWFGKKKKDVGLIPEKAQTQPRARKKQKTLKSKSNPPQQKAKVKTRTVIFVEQTRNGQLAKDIRQVLTGMENILGFRTKVVERTGTSMKQAFSNTNPWSGEACGRVDCVTYMQGGEEKPSCTTRNLVYENICLKCNPEASKKGELVQHNTEVPSIYVGETSRSIKERAKEHWDSYRSKNQDSHILKHHEIHHGSQGEPAFIMKVVKFHRSALSRQVGEAIRILKRGVVLNNRSEFNRCSISRLTLEQKENDILNQNQSEDDFATDWSGPLLARRDESDRSLRRKLGRAGKRCGVKMEQDEGA